MMTEYQKFELNILKEIIKVLDKHDLKYYAIGGTCIGAVRHKGFIPWDDDIDIAMPRRDYELLRNLYYKELPDYIEKLDYENARHHEFLFFKLHNANTTMIDCYAKGQPDRFTGAFVDIMPVDEFDFSLKSGKQIIRKINLLIKLFSFCRLSDIFPRKGLGKVQYLKDIPKKIIGCFIKDFDIQKRIESTFAKYEKNDFDKVCFTWRIGAVGYSRIVFDADWFENVIDMPFEDITIKVPEKYDLYLRQDFGDYLKLPPEENRNSGHTSYICDMSKPYKYYAEIERNKI